MKDLIGNYSERLGQSATAVVDGAQYEAQQVETETVRINDPGQGEAVVIRHFFFAAQPLPYGTPKPTKQQLFNEFKNMISMQLWGDGLEPIEDGRIEVHTKGYLRKISPTLYKKMTQEKADFVIMVPARAKKGVLLHEKPSLAL